MKKEIVEVLIASKRVKKPASISIEESAFESVKNDIEEFKNLEDNLAKRWFMIVAPMVYILWGETRNQEKLLEKLSMEQRCALMLALLYVKSVIEEDQIGHA